MDRWGGPPGKCEKFDYFVLYLFERQQLARLLVRTMETHGVEVSRRATLRLSRASKEGAIRSGRAIGVRRGASGTGHATPQPAVNTEEAAMTVVTALEEAAATLGPGPVEGENSSPQILSDASSRISVVVGSPGCNKKIDRHLCPRLGSLQQWVRVTPGPKPRWPTRASAPVQSLSVRRPAASATATSQTCRLLPRSPVSWRWVLALLMVLFFPRLVALSDARVVRLALKPLSTLRPTSYAIFASRPFKVTAELEEQMVARLQQHSRWTSSCFRGARARAVRADAGPSASPQPCPPS